MSRERRPLGVRFHERVLHHTVRVNRMITVPGWDPDPRVRGELWTCSCKKTWAR